MHVDVRSSMPDYIGNFTGEYPTLHTARRLRYGLLSAYQKNIQTEQQLATETVSRHRETLLHTLEHRHAVIHMGVYWIL
jgi:hypothetical protein